MEVYGPSVMSKQMVRRWCRTFSVGRQLVEDIPRAGRTRTATTDANVGKVDDMIRANRRNTIDEVAEEFGISHERARNIIHDILRYRKVSARWGKRSWNGFPGNSQRKLETSLVDDNSDKKRLIYTLTVHHY
ncbi:histone-lysine N-methyltransferase SETMAR [Trichonephila inaurata madagascariensis]|uniref:Histone-lysine N-methyltransferase SETMAR n=1 Tax=Trichonephila inaurata madagascariensis TaxID=2747483 RepID=A0A8X6XHV9_9ARAC|nr:histone-lysine N-methyltransferase SETMAR [Trichonephila inaurata madagascariensis]